MGPLLELFSDSRVQPAAEDCEKLQRQIYSLLDHLSVYKHNKQNYELSPSYTLHARISEIQTQVPEPTGKEPAAAEPESSGIVPEKNVQEKKTETEKPAETKNVKNIKSLNIGLNDKFRFINELFAKNNAEYNIALEQLSNLHSWAETEIYLNSLKSLYGWRESQESVKHFYNIVRKRFQ